jgi:protein-disulfide isomerase
MSSEENNPNSANMQNTADASPPVTANPVDSSSAGGNTATAKPKKKGKKSWRDILLILNTVLMAAVIGYLGYNFDYINEVTSTIKENNKRRAEANKPKPVGISNNALAQGSQTMGKADAPVTIVKFNSFSCSYCRLANQVVNQITSEFPNEVKIVYKHYSRGGSDPVTGQAVECAGEQGKFWQAYNSLFENQKDMFTKMKTMRSEADFQNLMVQYLKPTGIQVARFKQCMKSEKYKSKVSQDSQMGQQIGVNGTPAYIINGNLYSGHRPIDFFRDQIEKALN